jgi:hypothetical protein
MVVATTDILLAKNSASAGSARVLAGAATLIDTSVENGGMI